MKQKKWIAAICVSIVIFAAFIFVISKYKDRNYIVEKYPEVSNLLSFLQQSKNDTVFVCDFNDLYRRLFLSKINDSIISFCNIYTVDNNGYMLIITPDSISIFEAPDYYAYFTLYDMTFDRDKFSKNPKLLFNRVEQTLDLIFRQEQIRFYRFIGFSKEKPNRAVFLDNFYGFYSSGSFCHTLTVKNNILNPKKWVFINDRISMNKYTWRFPFPDNMVPQDSILPRIRRVGTCKDTIVRNIMYAE